MIRRVYFFAFCWSNPSSTMAASNNCFYYRALPKVCQLQQPLFIAIKQTGLKKHFHTAIPIGGQYESAFVRSHRKTPEAAKTNSRRLRMILQKARKEISCSQLLYEFHSFFIERLHTNSSSRQPYVGSSKPILLAILRNYVPHIGESLRKAAFPHVGE